MASKGKNRNKRIISLLLVCMTVVLVAGCFFDVYGATGATVENGSTDKKASSDRRVVTVGWYDSEFNSKDEFDRRSGYAYEYQQEIAAYTGWEFEYVEGGWTELMGKLEKGEIDLMSDVSYTEERSGRMLFSASPMGNEEYDIIVTADNDTISPDDYSTLNGKRVGISGDSYQLDLYRKWEKENGVKSEIVELHETEDDHARRLRSGDLDALVDFTAFSKYMSDSIPLIKIGSSDIYFAINKNKPEIKQELDAAMNQVLSQNPGYNESLNDKYIANSGAARYLTSDETRWLDKHGQIKVGYRDDYLPFSGTDSGKVSGLLKDYIDDARSLMKNAQVNFQPVAYKTTEDAMAALEDGEIDVVFPVNYSDYDAEKKHLLITDSFGENKMDIVIRKSEVDSFDPSDKVTTAVVSGDTTQATIIMDNYPQWRSVKFKTPEQCIKAVASGDADAYLLSDYRLGNYRNLIESRRLATLNTGTTVKEAFAVNDEDIMLYSVMCKLTNAMNEADVYGALSRYATRNEKTSVGDFTRDHLAMIVLLLIIVLLIISVLLFRTSRSSREARKANEQLLLAKEEADQASKAKTDFLFNMSHDIRTPMNAIIGFTDMALMRQDDTEFMKESLHKISLSSEQLLGLINDILDLSRIEHGNVDLNPEPASITAICENVRSMFSAPAAEKDIELTLDTSGIEHDGVVCDSKAVNRILVNIISNSIKFTELEGRVSVKVTEEAGGGLAKYRFVIEDNGIGMSQEFLKKIYDSFERERTSTVSRTQGTGLGMAIVKHLVDSLGGEIDIASKQGEGTRFFVTLPMEVSDELVTESEVRESAAEESLAGKRVLLVEDILANREIAKMILAEQGVEVDEAVDGKEALEKFQADPDRYDGILMDVQMPVMNGYEATRAIRALKDPRGAQVPIIAMTANAFAEDRTRAIESGMNDHIAKPINIPEFYQVLAKYIG